MSLRYYCCRHSTWGARPLQPPHGAGFTGSARARHFLVIGPWDHPGTRTPKQEFLGMKFGAASLVDLPKLHLDWYRFTMEGGSEPEFLQKQVAYYVSGANMALREF